ncbi:MAG: hypothetical protein ACOZEN_14955 [Thermodesulfobacteriota bacterium]
MAMTPQNIAAALAAHPEIQRLNTGKATQDQTAFKAMLTSQLGVSQDIMAGKGKDLLSMVARMPQPREDALSGVKNPVQAGSSVRGRIASNEIRGSIDKSARHPEDLGHLPGAGAKGGLPEGFTKEEENLLLAAAAAESKFLAAKRHAAVLKEDAKYARNDRLGVLSAAYESRGAIDAIGYDGRGGTSYGLYQIASGVGTMGRFLDYLGSKAPELASRLSSSGPANTGGRGGAMAQEWKRISAEQPNRFEALQHEFIASTHYQPALKSITLSTGEDISKRSQAVREVLWSTAVQHGPGGASEIFTQAVDKLQGMGRAKSDKDLIEEVYRQRMVQFAGRGRLRVAVTSRLADEKESALAMLDGKRMS